jgi:hypothetical protein
VTRVEILDFVNKNTYKIVEKIELGNVLGIIVFFRKLSVNTRRRPVGGSKPRAPAFLSACPQKYSLDNLKLRPFRMYNLKEFDSREVRAFQSF